MWHGLPCGIGHHAQVVAVFRTAEVDGGFAEGVIQADAVPGFMQSRVPAIVFDEFFPFQTVRDVGTEGVVGSVARAGQVHVSTIGAITQGVVVFHGVQVVVQGGIAALREFDVDVLFDVVEYAANACFLCFGIGPESGQGFASLAIYG